MYIYSLSLSGELFRLLFCFVVISERFDIRSIDWLHHIDLGVLWADFYGSLRLILDE